MNRTVLLALALLAMLLPALVVVPTAGGQSAAPMRFGMDAGSTAAQANAGAKPDYGTIWIGPWTLSSGWGGPNAAMDRMVAAGITPAIHFYYWGDDISRSCVENGCWSNLHNTWKDKNGWQRLARELGDALNARMKGKPVLVLVETEFNKNGIGDYEAFDGYLRDKIRYLDMRYPAAQFVLAFGNWASHQWGTYDRAAGASDYVGVQGMRGSTRDSLDRYRSLYESTLAGVQRAHALFGKATFITDIALSSYPEPGYLEPQRAELREFFANLATLKSAGVRGMLYRAWFDNPNMDTKNYYGVAERHWGLAYPGGSWKPAAKVWVDGVRAERSASSSGFSPVFEPRGMSNPWWVEVKITANEPVVKAEARLNGGAWTDLPKTSWGTFAKSMHAPAGTKIEFRATGASGATAVSKVFVAG
ncbi:MAG TPA: hypothetical protein VM681_10290 [Candidatus Thermoplasmatota archaeon]|nr:hypothetical protein [Candidatus Thermoplasmatota archaeon]